MVAFRLAPIKVKIIKELTPVTVDITTDKTGKLRIARIGSLPGCPSAALNTLLLL